MPTLALCMIVKNAADSIRTCLSSVEGIADQIVIADTGCTDNTCDIAREFGAIIVPFPWQDHFAKARNAALAAATTDWVLVLDADEELDAAAKGSIAALLSAPDVGGYLIPIREYASALTRSAWTVTFLPNESEKARAKGARTYFVNTLCRLFRRREDIYFTGRVHEMVQPQVEAAGLTMGTAPFCIHHYGHLVSLEGLTRKRLFYHGLVARRLADDSTDATSLTQCGLDEWEVHGRPLEALRYFRRALDLHPNSFETWLLSAKVLCAIHKYEDALGALDVVCHVEKDAHLQNTLRGDALQGLGRTEEARAAYTRALTYNPKDRQLQAKLDYLYMEVEDSEAVMVRLRRAAAELSDDVEIHEFLVNACIRTGRIAEAADEADRFMKLDAREAFFLRPASLRAQLRQWDRVEIIVQECLALYPGSAKARELLMMSLIAMGRLEEAAGEAELLTGIVIEPRSFMRAAGIYARLNNKVQMRKCLQRGLQLFPNSAQIQSALTEAGLVSFAHPGSGSPSPAVPL